MSLSRFRDDDVLVAYALGLDAPSPTTDPVPVPPARPVRRSARVASARWFEALGRARKVEAMLPHLEDRSVDELEAMTLADWRKVADAAGVRTPSPRTRAMVLEVLRAGLDGATQQELAEFAYRKLAVAS